MLTRHLVLGAVLFSGLAGLAWPTRAEDIVHFRHPHDGREVRATGEILDYTARQLRIRGSAGNETSISSSAIVRIDSSWTVEHGEADRLMAAGQFDHAIGQFRAAYGKEPRPWARQRILAQIIWCYRAPGQLELAGDYFAQLVQAVPDMPYLDAVPLVWGPYQPSAAMERQSKVRLQEQGSPAVALMGASWLLSGADARSASDIAHVGRHGGPSPCAVGPDATVADASGDGHRRGHQPVGGDRGGNARRVAPVPTLYWARPSRTRIGWRTPRWPCCASPFCIHAITRLRPSRWWPRVGGWRGFRRSARPADYTRKSSSSTPRRRRQSWLGSKWFGFQAPLPPRRPTWRVRLSACLEPNDPGPVGLLAGGGPRGRRAAERRERRGRGAPSGLFDLLLFFCGGWVGFIIVLFIFVLSLTGAYLAFEHLMSVRQHQLMPEGLADKTRKLLVQGRIADAEAACRANPSFLAFVLLNGIAEIEGGWSAVEKAMEDAVAEQSARLFRKIEYLSVIGNIAPMLGLLGTVTGMILAFYTVAATQGTAGAADLAEGIYQALVTTVAGLIVAIPSLGAFAVLRNRADQLVAEVAYAAQHVFTPLKRRRVRRPEPPASLPREGAS